MAPLVNVDSADVANGHPWTTLDTFVLGILSASAAVSLMMVIVLCACCKKTTGPRVIVSREAEPFQVAVLDRSEKSKSSSKSSLTPPPRPIVRPERDENTRFLRRSVIGEEAISWRKFPSAVHMRTIGFEDLGSVKKDAPKTKKPDVASPKRKKPDVTPPKKATPPSMEQKREPKSLKTASLIMKRLEKQDGKRLMKKLGSFATKSPRVENARTARDFEVTPSRTATSTPSSKPSRKSAQPSVSTESLPVINSVDVADVGQALLYVLSVGQRAEMKRTKKADISKKSKDRVGKTDPETTSANRSPVTVRSITMKPSNV